MKFRRAPRAARRGRKFKARPTSHDGFDVIAAYGNRPGGAADGRLVGRNGRNVIVCRDGYLLSVVAGGDMACTPKLVHPRDQPLRDDEVPADYRGPYSSVEICAQAPPVFDFDLPDTEPRGPIPVQVVRALIRLHGGVARMRPTADRHEALSAAATLARIRATSCSDDLIGPDGTP